MLSSYFSLKSADSDCLGQSEARKPIKELPKHHNKLMFFLFILRAVLRVLCLFTIILSAARLSRDPALVSVGCGGVPGWPNAISSGPLHDVCTWVDRGPPPCGWLAHFSRTDLWIRTRVATFPERSFAVFFGSAPPWPRPG